MHIGIDASGTAGEVRAAVTHALTAQVEKYAKDCAEHQVYTGTAPDGQPMHRSAPIDASTGLALIRAVGLHVAQALAHVPDETPECGVSFSVTVHRPHPQ